MKLETLLLLLVLFNVNSKERSFLDLVSWKESWLKNFRQKHVCQNNLGEYLQPLDNYENHSETETITINDDSMKCRRCLMNEFYSN